MPYFRMGGGAGHFASTVTVPKYNGPSTHGYELLVNNVYDNLQMLFEEGNINGTARFNKMTQCLGGIAKTKWRNLIATANYQPPAARTNADFEAAFQDFTSKLHTNTYLGNDLQEATKNFEWDQMKTHENQNYPDDITTQEARLAEIDDWAVNRCHFQGNPLDDAGKIRRMMKRLPQGYKRFLKVTRGVDPFDPVNPPTLEELIEILDEYWEDCKEQFDRKSNKSKKRSHNDEDSQNSRKKGCYDKSSEEEEEYSDIESEGDSESEENNQEPRPNDYVDLNDEKCKWKSSDLNPKCDKFDWNKSKDFHFEQNCKNAPWYRNIFSEELSCRREYFRSERKRRRAQHHFQSPRQDGQWQGSKQPQSQFYRQPPHGHLPDINGQGYADRLPPAKPPAPPSSYYQWHAPKAIYGPTSGQGCADRLPPARQGPYGPPSGRHW